MESYRGVACPWSVAVRLVLQAKSGPRMHGMTSDIVRLQGPFSAMSQRAPQTQCQL
jgi:hypothetical protein